MTSVQFLSTSAYCAAAAAAPATPAAASLRRMSGCRGATSLSFARYRARALLIPFPRGALGSTTAPSARVCAAMMFASASTLRGSSPSASLKCAIAGWSLWW